MSIKGIGDHVILYIAEGNMSKTRIKGLHFIAENDPERYRNRTVKPEKGRGRKNRPRKKSWEENPGSSGFYNLTCGPR